MWRDRLGFHSPSFATRKKIKKKRGGDAVVVNSAPSTPPQSSFRFVREPWCGTCADLSLAKGKTSNNLPPPLDKKEEKKDEIKKTEHSFTKKIK